MFETLLCPQRIHPEQITIRGLYGLELFLPGRWFFLTTLGFAGIGISPLHDFELLVHYSKGYGDHERRTANACFGGPHGRDDFHNSIGIFAAMDTIYSQAQSPILLEYAVTLCEMLHTRVFAYISGGQDRGVTEHGFPPPSIRRPLFAFSLFKILPT